MNPIDEEEEDDGEMARRAGEDNIKKKRISIDLILTEFYLKELFVRFLYICI
jgi:hypothetical protein